MIVGNGLIAKALKKIDDPKKIFFASGVSNSLETRVSEFERESLLLSNTILDNKDKKIIYFSTLSIHDQSKQDSAYVLHKKKMENYIQDHCDNYLILRIGNVVGNGGNQNTLLNFLNNQIQNSTQFNLHKNARRLLVDIDDIPYFLKENSNNWNHQIINFAFPYYFSLKEVILCLEKKLSKQAHYIEINEGDFYKVKFEESVNTYFASKSSEEYLQKLADKYL